MSVRDPKTVREIITLVKDIQEIRDDSACYQLYTKLRESHLQELLSDTSAN